MGQYFYFFNKTRKVKSEVGCNSNFGLEWMKNLNRYTDKTASEIFLQIIKDNNWSSTDTIIASGDYDDIVTYENGKITGCNGQYSDE